MRDGVVAIADNPVWSGWDGDVVRFADLSRDDLAGRHTVLIAVGNIANFPVCHEILTWKRDGLLDDARLIFATYKGRHFWSPENEKLVHRWVVHASSEREVLDSEKLVFVPLCLPEPSATPEPGDDGYLFMGGRKWREIELGIEAMSRSGRPSRVVTDLAPEGRFRGVEITRERIAYDRYLGVMARARVVLAPLKWLPMSHGHTDVVAAVMSGKPVVVTAGASCDDYVEHGVNGLLVRENSVEAWVDAIHEAWERADEFAAAAREMAPRYGGGRYAGYVREVVDDPDRRLVRADPARRSLQAPRAEWAHLQQEIAIRDRRAAHQKGVGDAKALLRERRYAEALAQAEPFLDGPFRDAALQTAMAAAVHVDPAKAEGFIREIVARSGETAALLANLARSLLAQRRLEAARAAAVAAVELDPAPVAARLCLATVLAEMGETEEALRVVEAGLENDLANPALRRARRDLDRRRVARPPG